MKFIKQNKNVFVQLKETTLQEIDIQPGETIHSYNKNGYYGSCGCIYATQANLNKQLEFHESKQIELK